MFLQKQWAQVWCVVVASVLSACLAPDEYEPIETSISGRVFDTETRAAVAGAIIRTEPISEQVTSNSEGYYRIAANVDIGAIYTVFADANGYDQNKATISVREGENAAVDIPLTQAGPVLEVETQTLHFGAQTDTRALVLRNRGTGNLNYSIATSGAAWLSVEGERSGIVTDTPITANIRVNRTGLGFGEYTGQLTITSNGGDSTVVVTLEVVGMDEPRLSVSPTQVDFGTDQNRTNFAIENFGTGTLTWQLVDLPSWLSASPIEGESSGEADQVTLTLNRSRLNGGENFGEFTVRSNHQDVLVPVKATVESMGPGDGPGGRPMDFVEGEIVSRTPILIDQPCGLVADRGSMWMGDCGAGRIFKQSADGMLEREHLLPADADIVDLARTPEAIYVLTASGRNKRIWRLDLDSSEFVETGLTSTQIVGIAFDGEYLCTWQGSSVYRRDPDTLELEVRAVADDIDGFLDYANGLFFTTSGVSMNGIYFQVGIQTFEAVAGSRVRPRDGFNIPVDASVVGGLAVEGEYLWILGQGVGEDGQHIVKVRLR